MKHVYEIINPSDHVILQCDDDLVAAIAVLVLGQGKYGLRRDAEKAGDPEVTALPVFILGGHEAWLKAKGIPSMAQLGIWVREHGLQIAACLDTAFYGTPRDFAALTKAIEKLPEDKRGGAIEQWNETKRTSMNNIGEACAELARWCRDNATGGGS